MALRSININAAGGNASVTSIDCGTSAPKLGGVIDVSAFPNLSDFRCIGHNVTEFKGMGNLKNVVTLNLSGNALAGSTFPDNSPILEIALSCPNLTS